MLVDANLLLYAADGASPFHETCARWLEGALNGNRRVGLPWPSLVAFVRIATNPRAAAQPLQPSEAWGFVEDWLAAPSAWVPTPTTRHAAVLGALIRTHHVGADLVADAHLAALAIEHGLAICSADSDFARFPEVRWHNPVTPG